MSDKRTALDILGDQTKGVEVKALPETFGRSPVPSDIDGPAGEASNGKPVERPLSDGMVAALREHAVRDRSKDVSLKEPIGPAGEAGDLIERLTGRAQWYDYCHPGTVKTPSLLREAAARLAALQQQRDEWESTAHQLARDELNAQKSAEASEALASSHQRRVEELTGALQPFADFASLSSFDKLPNNAPMTVGSGMAAKQVTAGAFKAARAALTPPEQGGKP